MPCARTTHRKLLSGGVGRARGTLAHGVRRGSARGDPQGGGLAARLGVGPRHPAAMNSQDLPGTTPLRFDRAREAGISRRELDSDEFVRVRRGVYLGAGVDTSSPEVRTRIAAEIAGARGCLGGWAAARVYEEEVLRHLPDRAALHVFDGRVPWPEGVGQLEPLLLCLDPQAKLTASPGIEPLRSRLEPEDAVVVDGLRLTSPVRTAFDLARKRTLWGGVIAVDRLVHLGIVGLDEFQEYVGRHRGKHGVRQATKVAALANGRAESPPETVTRLLWLEAGLPQPEVNVEIFDAQGEFVARVDMLEPRTRVAVEYDGEHHASAAQRSRDS
ncbi:MAG: hypothetical protein GX593_03065, partial [Actinomycetales bacterium]|nr:hypothetical protein [Actinomycetales bacterium]